MAKYTPMPETKKSSGIRQMLSIAIGVHNAVHGLGVVINPIITPHD